VTEPRGHLGVGAGMLFCFGVGRPWRPSRRHPSPWPDAGRRIVAAT